MFGPAWSGGGERERGSGDPFDTPWCRVLNVQVVLEEEWRRGGREERDTGSSVFPS